MIIETGKDRELVKNYLTEAMKATMRKNDEVAQITDIIKTLHEQCNITPRVARKAIASMVKGNSLEVKEENEQLEMLLDIVI